MLNGLVKMFELLNKLCNYVVGVVFVYVFDSVDVCIWVWVIDLIFW